MQQTHPIHQFVITGGPCAGKSTCLSVLDNALSEKGIRTIVVSETATEVITSGMSFMDLPEIVFQGNIMRNSYAKEESARAAAKIYAQKSPVVILYDRGIPDGKAYMDAKNYSKSLANFELNEISARDQYDAVFHLVTAAKGAEQAYTTLNNAARSETPEQAIDLDTKTMQAWVGHPHLRVIDNSTSFEGKINRLVGEVFSVLGLPVPIEIEKKYLIKRPSRSLILSFGAVKSEILQTYLKEKEAGVERRVRQRGINGQYSYFYTEKSDASDGGRIEREQKINQSEYLKLLMQGVAQIRKDRYCFVHTGQYFELDIYPNWKKEAVLELELTNQSQKIDVPSSLTVLRDATDLPEYKNRALAEAFSAKARKQKHLSRVKIISPKI